MSLEDYHFLVVDDHAFARHSVINELVKLGAPQPDEASNGMEALEKIKKKQNEGKVYDIIFLDWAMPEMNGYDVLLACRKDPALNDMAIVMVSAESEEANVLQAIADGASAYISKPFQSEMLIHKLNDIIGWKAGLPEFDGDG